MKLNKNGWGTIEMFLLSGGLLIALLVAIFFISQFYSSMGLNSDVKQYNDLEIRIENAAKQYIEDNNIQISGEYKLTLSSIKNNGYITDFEDNNHHNCNGYVLINGADGNYSYQGYILCDNYQTSNY